MQGFSYATAGTSSGAHQMQPTWTGFIHTTHDALMILEACLSGRLHHIPRRPHDRERSRLISSGNVFVYEENASGIKRWTDGMTWSPSRIMGNFLVYRELNPNNYATGEKKVARKRKRTEDPVPDAFEPGSGRLSPGTEEDRRLVGSLVDSYGFKPEGLVKKTLTVQYQNVIHHIIAYYTTADIKNGNFRRPVVSDLLQDVVPRPELLNGNFKAPIHEAEDGAGMASPTNSTGPQQMELPTTYQSVPYPAHSRSYSVQNYGGRSGGQTLHPIQTAPRSSAYVPPRTTISHQYHIGDAQNMTASPSGPSSATSGHYSPAYQSLRYNVPTKPRRSNSTNSMPYKREDSCDDYAAAFEPQLATPKRARTNTPTGSLIESLSLHDSALVPPIAPTSHTPFDDSHVGIWNQGQYDISPQPGASSMSRVSGLNESNMNLPMPQTSLYYGGAHATGSTQLMPQAGYHHQMVYASHAHQHQQHHQQQGQHHHHDPRGTLHLYQDPSVYTATTAGSS